MNEPVDPADSPKRTSLAKCERHGLHYDPAKMSGCVICRREAGGEPLASPSSMATTAAPGEGSYTAPLLVAGGLCLGFGIALFWLHGAVAGYARASGAFGRGESPEVSTPQSRQMEKALKELEESMRNPTAATSDSE